MSGIEQVEVQVTDLELGLLNYAIAMALEVKVEYFDDAIRLNAANRGYSPDAAEGVISRHHMRGMFCVRDEDGFTLNSIPDYQANLQKISEIVSQLRGHGLIIGPNDSGGWKACLKNTNNEHVANDMYVAALKCFVELKNGKTMKVPASLVGEINKTMRMKV